MTTLVALQQDGEVWVGSDSQCTDRDIIIPVIMDKWVVKRPWAIGVCGAIRAIDVMRERAPKFLTPKAKPAAIIEAVREALIEDGFTGGNDSGIGFNASFVLAHKRYGVISTGNSFDASPVIEGCLYADGSGRELAFGAGAAFVGSAEDRCRTALEIACRFDAGSGGPLFLEKL